MVGMRSTIVTKHTFKMTTEEVEGEELGESICQVDFTINFLVDEELVPDPFLGGKEFPSHMTSATTRTIVIGYLNGALIILIDGSGIGLVEP